MTAPVGPRAPRPRLSDLCDLVARVRQAGLRVEVVEVVEEGRPAEIGLAFEPSAYRIVREALGDILRQARARSAHVTLCWRPGLLDVLVRDDGQGPPAPVAWCGLLGVRERVAMFGGTFEAGPLSGGGFAVRARLPAAGETRPAPHPAG